MVSDKFGPFFFQKIPMCQVNSSKKVIITYSISYKHTNMIGMILYLSPAIFHFICRNKLKGKSGSSPSTADNSSLLLLQHQLFLLDLSEDWITLNVGGRRFTTTG